MYSLLFACVYKINLNLIIMVHLHHDFMIYLLTGIQLYLYPLKLSTTKVVNISTRSSAACVSVCELLQRTASRIIYVNREVVGAT